MFNEMQRLDAQAVAIFCFNNINNNDDFDSFPYAKEIYRVKSLYFDMYPEAAMPNTVEAVLAVFTEYLKGACAYTLPIDLEYLALSKKMDLSLLKEKAIADENRLKDFRINGVPLDEYISAFLRINKANHLIYSKEAKLFEAADADHLGNHRRLTEEVARLVEDGLPESSQYVRTLQVLCDLALRNFITYNLNLIYTLSGETENIPTLQNLEQQYLHDASINIAQASIFNALAEYVKMTLCWHDPKLHLRENLLKVYVYMSKIKKINDVPELYELMKLPVFRVEALKLATDWILNVKDGVLIKVLTRNELQDRSKFISSWQHYLAKDELSHVIGALAGWSLNYAGANLRVILACNLRLQKHYTEFLSVEELKQYYDSLAAEHIGDDFFTTNKLWFAGCESHEKPKMKTDPNVGEFILKLERCLKQKAIKISTEYYKTLATSGVMRSKGGELSKYAMNILDERGHKSISEKSAFEITADFRNTVRMHYYELLEYIAKILDQYDASWHNRTYNCLFNKFNYAASSDSEFDLGSSPISVTASNSSEDDLISDEYFAIGSHKINLNKDEDRPIRCSTPSPYF